MLQRKDFSDFGDVTAFADLQFSYSDVFVHQKVIHRHPPFPALILSDSEQKHNKAFCRYKSYSRFLAGIPYLAFQSFH